MPVVLSTSVFIPLHRNGRRRMGLLSADRPGRSPRHERSSLLKSIIRYCDCRTCGSRFSKCPFLFRTRARDWTPHNKTLHVITSTLTNARTGGMPLCASVLEKRIFRRVQQPHARAHRISPFDNITVLRVCWYVRFPSQNGRPMDGVMRTINTFVD